MKKEEILEKSRLEKHDEGQKDIVIRSSQYGEIGLIVCFIVLIVFKLFNGLPAQDLLSLFWAYLGMKNVYRYQRDKSKANLIAAVCGMIASVCFALAYFFQW